MRAQKDGATGKSTSRKAFLLLALFLFGTLLLSAAARANQAGLDWLAAQVQADGGIATPAEEATAHHSTYESAQTLLVLSPGNAVLLNALAYLGNDTNAGIPYLPRRLVASLNSGLSANTLLAELLSHQNPDGGFSALPGEQSTVLDTIEALDALRHVGANDRQTIEPAVRFLTDRQLNDGSFSPGVNSPYSLYLTARAAVLFQHHLVDYQLAIPLQASTDFLWKHKDAGHGWGADWESAHVLLALISVTTDPARYADAVNAIRVRQRANGSWSDSAYATAMALRVLKAVEDRRVVARPTGNIVSGRVFDSASGVPVAGATVALPGGLEARTGADGRYQFENVGPGTYLVEYRHPAYVDIVETVDISAMRWMELGTVHLTQRPELGIVEGLVTDYSTGLPLADAMVTVTGAVQGGASTGADGRYQIVLPSGQMTVAVTAAGYAQAEASGTVIAGGTVRFSPVLTSSTNTSGSLPILSGRVVDGTGSTPIVGALVSATSATAGVSGLTGDFEITNIQPGELLLDIQAAGYRSATLMVLAPTVGQSRVGDIFLQENGPILTSTLSGKLVDAETGEAIIGEITVDGITALTDVSGSFIIDAIQNLNLTVAIRADGYLGDQFNLSLAEHGHHHAEFTLSRVSLQGIDIVDLTSTQEAYPAFTEARLTAHLANSGTVQKAIRLYVRVKDSQGRQVEEYPVIQDIAAGSGTIIIGPGATSQADIVWNTQHFAPGTYRIHISAFDDAYTSELLAERVATVAVNETRLFTDLRLAPNVGHSNQGTSESIGLLLSLQNRSNVPLDIGISYQWLDPLGNTLKVGSATANITPETLSTTLHLENFEHLFQMPGNYPFEITSVTGVDTARVHAGEVVIAPDIRIEVVQELTPGTVLPQGNARLRMGIRIEGVNVP